VAKKGEKPEISVSECLILVFADVDIKAGAELLTTYGDAYWQK
jgi:hypothetical protein